MKADAKKITRRLRIVRGQVDGILKMVEEDRYCIDISNQLMAAIAALKSINRAVLSAHLTHCVADSMQQACDATEDPQRQTAWEQKIREIEAVIEKLSK